LSKSLRVGLDPQLTTAQEEELIRQDLKDEDLSSINAHTNQSLHCMAAHLHRYGSELQSFCDVVQDIKLYNSWLHDEFVACGIRHDNSFGSIATTLDQIASYLSAISGFRDELQQKIDNILALVGLPGFAKVTCVSTV
jgi:hypothetical protein